MSIATTTTAKNRVFLSDAPKSVFADARAVITTAVSFKQGDLIALDTTNHRLKAVTALTDGANFLGVAQNTIASGLIPGSNITSAVDASTAISDVAGPVFGVVCKMKLKASDAFNPGDFVYLADGQDCQTVSSTDSGDHYTVGIFVDTAVASAASGQEGKIRIGARYASASLQV